MIRFALIDGDGELVRVVEVSDEAQAAINVPAGHTRVDTLPNADEAHWTGSAWVPRPGRPAPYSTWNPSAKAWEDRRPLPALKAAALAAMQAAFRAAATAPVTAGGQQFVADRERIAQLAGRAARQGNNGSLNRTVVLADGTSVTLSKANILALADALDDQIDAAYDKLVAKRAAIRAATTPAAVKAVVW